MKMTIKDLETNLSDNDYANELLEQLELLYDNFDTIAMSDWVLYLKGKHEMLGEIIEYIKFTK